MEKRVVSSPFVFTACIWVEIGFVLVSLLLRFSLISFSFHSLVFSHFFPFPLSPPPPLSLYFDAFVSFFLSISFLFTFSLFRLIFALSAHFFTFDSFFGFRRSILISTQKYYACSVLPIKSQQF